MRQRFPPSAPHSHPRRSFSPHIGSLWSFVISIDSYDNIFSYLWILAIVFVAYLDTCDRHVPYLLDSCDRIFILLDSYDRHFSHLWITATVLLFAFIDSCDRHFHSSELARPSFFMALDSRERNFHTFGIHAPVIFRIFMDIECYYLLTPDRRRRVNFFETSAYPSRRRRVIQRQPSP